MFTRFRKNAQIDMTLTVAFEVTQVKTRYQDEYQFRHVVQFHVQNNIRQFFMTSKEIKTATSTNKFF